MPADVVSLGNLPLPHDVVDDETRPVRHLSRLRRLLKEYSGMVLGRHKRFLAERVLMERSVQVGADNVMHYLDMLEADRWHPEWEHFINAFMINHTAFFREEYHFEILDKFIRSRPQPVHVWCAAASSGEEPYSIAMTLQAACPGRFTLWATDIDTDALAQARQGVYSLERIAPIPPEDLRRYFLRGEGTQQGYARVKPELASTVRFSYLNLAATHWWDGNPRFDAIFCRNTLIYFDRTLQETIMQRFVQWLKPGGLIFVGHSESYTDLRHCVQLRGKSVYAGVGGAHG